jgi:hypothetical protein
MAQSDKIQHFEMKNIWFKMPQQKPGSKQYMFPHTMYSITWIIAISHKLRPMQLRVRFKILFSLLCMVSKSTILHSVDGKHEQKTTSEAPKPNFAKPNTIINYARFVNTIMLQKHHEHIMHQH